MSPTNQAAKLWRIAMAQMAALNALAVDRRKWAMLPDWRRRERRIVAEARLNHHFNEIERILAQRSTPDTHRRPHHGRQQSRPTERLPVAGVLRWEGIGWGVYVDHGNGCFDHYPVGPSREDAEAEAERAQAESQRLAACAAIRPVKK